MGLMDGKVVLIFGIANKNSIAWGIAQKLHAEGATIAISYAMESLERRVRPLAEQIDCDFVQECDVTNDAALDNLFANVKERFGTVDTVVHSIAFAKREDLGGRFIDVSRDGFHLAMDISAYSLIAIAKRAELLMPNGGSIMNLSYFAAEKVVLRYNAMAIAKTALEAITRYLANDLGPKNIRVNSISAGPIKTLSAGGIPGFRAMLHYSEKVAPLRTLVSQDDVGDAALFLASDLSRMITGEIMHVDAGYNILGMTVTEEDLDNLEANSNG